MLGVWMEYSHAFVTYMYLDVDFPLAYTLWGEKVSF